MDQFTAIDVLTFSLAVLGSVLGVINTWHNLDKRLLKLDVRPKHAIPVGAADPQLQFCVEVTNRSSFPVTISEVGFLHKNRTGHRSTVVEPYTLDGGGPLPRRLEPRSSVTFYFERPKPSRWGRIKCAYARTQCGSLVKGNSPALKQLANEIDI